MAKAACMSTGLGKCSSCDSQWWEEETRVEPTFPSLRCARVEDLQRHDTPRRSLKKRPAGAQPPACSRLGQDPAHGHRHLSPVTCACPARPCSTPQPPLNRRQRWCLAKRKRQMCDAGEPWEFVVSLNESTAMPGVRSSSGSKSTSGRARKL
ncbi:hypothetical protein DUNSADRAFT_8687 [Dunaliella salina]|uniref:Encoded protein n=1 Tax=Dunaliella salina TaxID=3046 RepID=A0ABQ7GJ15_DUNSA|nr:hypothetical protein DUNSADRAFT_8687 [Dunaliella salina]|eukprot:KAF5834603.1 hypothetical protein DUNSADRAFT_8687 [Dunaliella salina]